MEQRGSDKVSHGLSGVREAARRDKNLQFTALLHHIDVTMLWSSYQRLKQSAAPGVDEVHWVDYQEGLRDRLEALYHRIHTGSYLALPSKRARLLKEDCSERKLGIAALEDKIVQQAVATVLNTIYEEDFIGFSYGFRSGRNQHQALDALCVGLTERSINYVVDLDVRGYFDNIQLEWLVRLIQKWLRAHKGQ